MKQTKANLNMKGVKMPLKIEHTVNPKLTDEEKELTEMLMKKYGSEWVGFAQTSTPFLLKSLMKDLNGAHEVPNDLMGAIMSIIGTSFVMGWKRGNVKAIN